MVGNYLHGTYILYPIYERLSIIIYLVFVVVDFFNRINLIYGTISEYCTDESCPTMSGGPRFEYLWADGVKYKKPTKLSASQYINLLMDWVEEQINNEELFPVSPSKIILFKFFQKSVICCNLRKFRS